MNRSQSVISTTRTNESTRTNHRHILKGMLPKGYAATLASKFGLKKQTINGILGGYNNDIHGVIEAAYQLAIDFKKEKKKEENKIEKLKEKVLCG